MPSSDNKGDDLHRSRGYSAASAEDLAHPRLDPSALRNPGVDSW